MKAATYRHIVTSALAAALLLTAGVEAQTLTINPALSSASITFNDTNSLAGGVPGAFYNVPMPGWNGSSFSLSQTDPTTTDTTQGTIAAAGGFNTYSLSFLPNATLTQAIPNTGFAILNFAFTIVYNITGGALILPAQAPTFFVNGTTQAPAGFAAVNGSIDYIGFDAAASYSVLETVNYNQTYSFPPATFGGTVPGVPVFGGPINGGTGLIAGTTLTLVGNLNFKVDPASISFTTAPEPSAGLLAMVAGLSMLLRRRRS